MPEFPKTQFKIYKSSAGSGKTYTLVLEYLKIVLAQPEAYRNVLAITFTNKAAGEMKSRIIDALTELRDGEVSGLIENLRPDVGLDEETIRENAGIVLSKILHDYANFAVSTIDSFTFRIVRNFSRDLELPSSFDVEMDTQLLLSRMVDQLMDSIGRDEYVTHILTRFAEEKIGQESAWHVDRDVENIAQSIFKENSRDSVDKLQSLGQDGFLKFIGYLEDEKERYPEAMVRLGKEALAMMEKAGISQEDFVYGKSGPGAQFEKLARRNQPADYERIFSGTRWKKAIEDDAWLSKNAPRGAEVTDLLDSGLRDLAHQMQQLHEAQYEPFVTAWYAYRNIHSLAVLKQVEDLVEEYKERNNIVHISDFNRKISEFIKEEPPDYIYWRLGEKFRHYLVDEFQDTSQLQWENLFPLFENIRAGGTEDGSLLLVGDSKQAIYRWRGGEVDLLEKAAPDFLGVEPDFLETNYRSKEAIVHFNNAFFSSTRVVLQENALVSQIYRRFEQKLKPGNEGEGYVKIELLDPAAGGTDFRTLALEAAFDTVRACLADGYRYADIAILVRRKEEGGALARHLAGEGVPVISSDSLLLAKSPVVNFMLSLLRLLTDPGDRIRQAEILHYYLLNHGEGIPEETIHKACRNILDYDHPAKLADFLPEGWGAIRANLEQLPLYELSETIVRLFGLNHSPDAYLQHFLDVVLRYSERKKPDISAFLEYWDEKSGSFSLAIPEGEDAVRIMTLHKSKGLQFPVVIMPMVNWSVKPKASSVLWGSAEEKLGGYTDTFLLPVRKELAASQFRAAYKEEVDRTVLDNVNLMYVGFTRPEERLYLFGQFQKDKSKTVRLPQDDIANASILLREALKTQPAKDVASTIDDFVWECGIPTPRTTPSPLAESQFGDHLLSTDWRARLRIRRLLREFWDDDEAGRDDLPLGTVAAEALRRMQSTEDLDRTLETLAESGLLAAKDLPRLRDWLRKKLAEAPWDRYFSAAVETRRNARLLAPGNLRLEADRLVRDGDRWIIIGLLPPGRDRVKLERDLGNFATAMRKMGMEQLEIAVLNVLVI